MAQIHAEATAVINTRPEAVYEILADYHNHHPHILPTQYFSNLQIEEGGKGAGTVFRLRSHLMNTQRDFHMRVTEPEPGRVLVEKDMLSDLVTTFRFTPVNNGQQTEVKITTDWTSSPGLMGLIERLVTPRAMRQIYTTELEQLANYLKGIDR